MGEDERWYCWKPAKKHWNVTTTTGVASSAVWQSEGFFLLPCCVSSWNWMFLVELGNHPPVSWTIQWLVNVKTNSSFYKGTEGGRPSGIILRRNLFQCWFGIVGKSKKKYVLKKSETLKIINGFARSVSSTVHCVRRITTTTFIHWFSLFERCIKKATINQ